MTRKFAYKVDWLVAVGSEARRANIELGMDVDEARAYAIKMIGDWEEPVQPATPIQVEAPLAEQDPGSEPAKPVGPSAEEIAAKAASARQAELEKQVEAERRHKDAQEAALRRAADQAREASQRGKAQGTSEVANAPSGANSHAWLWAVGGVVATLAYCAAELAYNMSLVEFVSSANTSADAFEGLERVGKALGALGLSMAVARMFFNQWKLLAALAVMAPVAYMAIDKSFNAYVDGLPHEVKVEGYYLGAYRTLVLGGQLADPDFAGPEASIERKLRLLNLPLAAGSGKDARAQVSEYVYGSDQDSKRLDKEIGELFGIYNSISRKIDPLYGYYAIESKKIPGGAFHNAYVRGFMKKSGGIPPGLTKEQFNEEIQKSYPSLVTYRATVAIPAQPSIGMAALRMGDIPAGLDEPAFHQFFTDHLKKAQSLRNEKAGEVETLSHSKSLISSTFVPPLSMSLSLLSVGLNAAASLSGLLLLGLFPWREARWHKALSLSLQASLTIAILGWMATRPDALTGVASAWQAKVVERSVIGAAWSKMINAEARVLGALAPALPAIHSAFIDDSHPDQVKKVQVAKAQSVDLVDLDQKLAALKASSEEVSAPAAAVDPSFYADEKRLGEKGYYGETRPAGGNPYAKK
jgi:hypothetical protein